MATVVKNQRFGKKKYMGVSEQRTQNHDFEEIRHHDPNHKETSMSFPNGDRCT